jgi:hypothetical protein
MQKWRFLYTDHSEIKKAVTKTGALKSGSLSKSHYVVTDGKDYSTCLQKAKTECGFKESQLLGSRRIE